MKLQKLHSFRIEMKYILYANNFFIIISKCVIFIIQKIHRYKRRNCIFNIFNNIGADHKSGYRHLNYCMFIILSLNQLVEKNKKILSVISVIKTPFAVLQSSHGTIKYTSIFFNFKVYLLSFIHNLGQNGTDVAIPVCNI